MSLRLALDISRSSLAANSERTAVVSRNVAHVNSAGVSRKSANLVTTEFGGVRVANVTRATNEALVLSLQKSSSQSAFSSAVLDGVEQMRSIVGDTGDEQSISSLIGKLRDGLQTYAASPSNAALGISAVSAAQNVAHALNEGSATIQAVRGTADKGIADGVEQLRTLLSRFEELDADIVTGTALNREIADKLDQRDDFISQISELIGIRTITRQDNSMVIFASNGAMLFETSAREVSFDPQATYVAGLTGNQVFIDGVPLQASASGTGDGRISGLMHVRDQVAPTFQSQLDEVARGLVDSFAESDQNAVPTLPRQAGLFTYAGGPAIPPAGTLVNGIAATITVNSNVVTSAGGDVQRLRDGQISDPGNPAYLYNSSLGASYSDRLNELADNLSAPMAFDAATQLESSGSLLEYSAASVSWFEETRSATSESAEFFSASFARTQATLQSETGVNLDEEMTTLLDLEKSYQATSRLISVIDQLFDSLLAAAR